MINDSQGKVDRVDFAKRLYNWMQYGFRELGDYGKGDLTSHEILSIEFLNCRWNGDWNDSASDSD